MPRNWCVDKLLACCGAAATWRVYPACGGGATSLLQGSTNTGTAGNSTANVNLVPRPGRVLTSSSAPKAVTSLLQMASPSPELEKWCRVVAGAFRNGWYRVRRGSG